MGFTLGHSARLPWNLQLNATKTVFCMPKAGWTERNEAQRHALKALWQVGDERKLGANLWSLKHA